MSDAQEQRDRTRGRVVLAACFAISAAWSSLAVFAGHPINDPVVPYVAYQLIAGFIAGIAAPRSIWGAWVATFLGQGFVFVVIGGLASSSTASIGLVLLPFFCLPALFAGCAALVKSIRL